MAARVVIVAVTGLLPWATWVKRGAGVGIAETVWCSAVVLLLVVTTRQRFAKLVARPVGYGFFIGMITGALELALNVWFDPDYGSLKCFVTALWFALCVGCGMGWWQRRSRRAAGSR